MNKTVGIVVAIVVVLGGWYWYSMSGDTNSVPPGYTPPTSNPPGVTSEQNNAVASTSPATATVTYGPGGFSPKTVTIAKGGTVAFTNAGSGRMWVASDPHPTHEKYEGTTKNTHCATGYTGPTPFDQCTASGSYTFTFTKSGTFGYHNHSLNEDGGTVVVQ